MLLLISLAKPHCFSISPMDSYCFEMKFVTRHSNLVLKVTCAFLKWQRFFDRNSHFSRLSWEHVLSGHRKWTYLSLSCSFQGFIFCHFTHGTIPSDNTDSTKINKSQAGDDKKYLLVNDTDIPIFSSQILVATCSEKWLLHGLFKHFRITLITSVHLATWQVSPKTTKRFVVLLGSKFQTKPHRYTITFFQNLSQCLAFLRLMLQLNS